MKEPAKYTMHLVGPMGEILSRRELRIWPEELLVTEYKGQTNGLELAREAMDHAGLLSTFAEQRKKDLA